MIVWFIPCPWLTPNSTCCIATEEAKPWSHALPALSFSAAFDLLWIKEGGMSQLRCHQWGGFAGFKSLLFGLLAVGLPGGMGLFCGTKVKPIFCNKDSFKVSKDIELSWSGATIETGGKSCIENEMIHNGMLTQWHIISCPANVSGWYDMQFFLIHRGLVFSLYWVLKTTVQLNEKYRGWRATGPCIKNLNYSDTSMPVCLFLSEM